jgi:cobalt-zinc-cadmium efflux system outer membrane protein
MPAVFLAVLMAVPLFAHAETLSLSAVENAVRERNPALQAAWISADEAQAQVSADGAWTDPELSYEWMQLSWPDPVLSEAGRRRLELTQTFPLFGQAGAKAAASRHGALLAQAQAREEEARLIFEAKDAYWSAQQAGSLVKAQVRTQAALAAMRKVSAQRGRFGRLDRMGQLMDAMLERELGTDEAMGLHWQAEERAARLRLERLMGEEVRPEGAWPDLAPAEAASLLAPSWTADEIWGHAEVRNPELQEAQHHVRHAQAELSAVRREWLPELMLEGGWEEGVTGRDASIKAGLNLPWLWFWGQKGRGQAAGLELKQAQAMVQDAEQMLREQCRLLASELYSSQAELKLSTERILPAAEKALQAAENGYASGDISPREAMDAVAGYWQAQEDYAHRLWHVGTTLAAIDRLMAAPALEAHHD